jgi:membrane protein implicated in regulation of membrane protease activity
MTEPTRATDRFNLVLFTAPVILVVVGVSILLLVPGRALLGLLAIALAVLSAVTSVRRYRRDRRESSSTGSPPQP